MKSILKLFDTQKAKDNRAFNDVAQAITEGNEGTEQAMGDDNAGEGLFVYISLA